MTPFRDFALAFFTTLGQTVTAQDERLQIALSGELADYYGRDELVLTFQPHDLTGELVAFGSRAFDAMLDYLAARGRQAGGRLPERDDPGVTVRLRNGAADLQDERTAPRLLYAFTFHLTSLSDERTETLATYCLDEAGRPSDEGTAWLEGATAFEPLTVSAEAPPEVVDAAERLAMEEADRMAIEQEELTLGRLRKAASRLVSYYEEQIAEVPLRRRKGQTEDEALDAALEERAALRRELGRKLGEETTRHQLRLQVRRISQAIVEVPGRDRAYRLQSPHAERSVSLWENRHTGRCEAPGCERCGEVPSSKFQVPGSTEPTDATMVALQGDPPNLELGTWNLELLYSLCADGHVVCDTCLGHCAECAQDHCRAELADCASCGGGTCERCRAECAGGHSVCRGHMASCRCCGQAFCEGCLDACPDCEPGARLARAHGHACGVCDRPVCEAHARGCALCGGALCGGHQVACPGCGDEVCQSHMGACAHCELPYCTRCRDEGPACRACGAVGQSLPAPEGWLSALASVPQAARYGPWLGIENDRYRYMLGRGLLGDLLVVTEADGRPVQIKEIGFWRKLFGWIG